MHGQAILNLSRDALAHGDVIEHDDLNHWVNVAKLGKTEIIMDVVRTFNRDC
jgi:hypothetical protein